MPRYAYRCINCEDEFDVIKPVAEIDYIEICEECGRPSERVIRFKGHMAADNVDAYYNYGLGKVVRSKAQVREELARVKGETGREFVEVGNEPIKPKKKKYKSWIDAEVISAYKKELSGYRKH